MDLDGGKRSPMKGKGMACLITDMLHSFFVWFSCLRSLLAPKHDSRFLVLSLRDSTGRAPHRRNASPCPLPLSLPTLPQRLNLYPSVSQSLIKNRRRDTLVSDQGNTVTLASLCLIASLKNEGRSNETNFLLFPFLAII